MPAVVKLVGVAAPFPADDVNTDQIAPIPEKMVVDVDYRTLLFAHLRRHSDGSLDPDFVLNRPAFSNARILVTGRNFGCGSSREGAVLALLKCGIQCVVARSFADLFRENSVKNGLLPAVIDEAGAAEFERAVQRIDGSASITVDLLEQKIICPSIQPLNFSISASDRVMLLEGLDEIALTLKLADAISAWEATTQQERPWLRNLRELLPR
jgi:3-isopropylmalate/(R)-2-methylmalate dehydratase small subunit